MPASTAVPARSARRCSAASSASCAPSIGGRINTQKLPPLRFALVFSCAMIEVMSDTPAKQPNRRHSRRQPPKGSVRAFCRKGTLGLGPNIAVRLLDLSEGGAQLVVSEELQPGQEV